MTLAGLNPVLVDRINRELLIETPLKPVDLCIVFGTRNGEEAFADEVARLWRRRLFRSLLITGGPTQGVSRSEATILHDLIRERGVPVEDAMLEHHATNTGENVIYSLPVIEQRLGLATVRSVIAVGKFWTSARYLMTLQRHWPSVTKMLASVHFHPVPRDCWMQHDLVREKVVEEWHKLARYKALGYIADLDPATCTWR
ncbi:YdcF family protein [Qingshengfaniella alkalisoli]|uniref:YdcF family protein n=1 Tax=Qingshengfaniella alkalisoli TaxID=2599296 RepID=A0A5B8IUS7_9RHOB|nr:YdcF family protein [Qingshengfaniella alkalisoli]QDY68621.1 YdcF family protein [Qingshengfaniella alkalisoli]